MGRAVGGGRSKVPPNEIRDRSEVSGTKVDGRPGFGRTRGREGHGGTFRGELGGWHRSGLMPCWCVGVLVVAREDWCAPVSVIEVCLSIGSVGLGWVVARVRGGSTCVERVLKSVRSTSLAVSRSKSSCLTRPGLNHGGQTPWAARISPYTKRNELEPTQWHQTKPRNPSTATATFHANTPRAHQK